jgi:hypothetical protein
MAWSRPGGSLAAKVGDWLRSAVRTAVVVARLPAGSLAIVMAPPVFAPLTTLAVARWRRVRVAIDAHSGAFNDDRWRWSFGIMAWVARRADALIVTNAELLADVDVGSTPVIVLHDPLNEVIEAEGRCPAPTRPRVLFPASGAADEPLEAVAEVARRLRDEVEIVVTGGRIPEPLVRAGVTAPGFVPRPDYLAWLRSADVVLALTTRAATMQRAAYEAAELGRALVCSDTKVLREAFGAMAEMTTNDPDGMEAAIRRALSDRDRLAAGAAAVVSVLRNTEGLAAARLRELVGR